MISDLSLSPDEVVILENQRVSAPGRYVYSDTLVLTHQRIIFLKKGLLGKIKSVTQYNLTDIKVYNNQAQAKMGKQQNGLPQLELFLTNTQVGFGFEFKKDVVNWVENINKLVTGHNVTINAGRLAIPGTEYIAKTLKGTIDTAKEIFGVAQKKQKAISLKCPYCGAPISGNKGESKICPYCDSYITLK